jgi:hypothetical protein
MKNKIILILILGIILGGYFVTFVRGEGSSEDTSLQSQWAATCPTGWVDTRLQDCDTGDGHKVQEDSCTSGGGWTRLCLKGNNLQAQWAATCPGGWVDTELQDCDTGDGHKVQEDSCTSGGGWTRLCLKQEDNNPPAITLNSPASGASFNSGQDMTFFFTAVDDTATTMDCRFFIDASMKASLSATNNILKSYTFTENLAPGAHSWYVQCDDGMLSGTSVEREFSIRSYGGPSPPPGPKGSLSCSSSKTSSISVRYSFSGVSNVNLYRGTSKIDTLTSSPGVYLNTGLNEGTSYTYYLKNGNTNLATRTCSTTGGTNPPPEPPLPAPEVSCSAVSSSQINLNWTNISGADHYIYYRCNSSNHCTPTTKIASNIYNLEKNDTGLNSNTTYRYRVRAWNLTNGLGLPSQPVECTTKTSSIIPPSNLYCGEYENSNDCEVFSEEVAKRDVERTEGENFCDTEYYNPETNCTEYVNCFCSWEDECKPEFEIREKDCQDDSSGKLSVTCTTKSMVSSGCVNGSMNVVWERFFSRSNLPLSCSNDTDCEGYLSLGKPLYCLDGKCVNDYCKSDSRTIICPSEVLLKFVTPAIILLVIVFLIVFYVLSSRKKKVSRRVKKKRK